MNLKMFFHITNLNAFLFFFSVDPYLIFIGCVVMKLIFIGSSNPTQRRS